MLARKANVRVLTVPLAGRAAMPSTSSAWAAGCWCKRPMISISPPLNSKS